VLLAEGVWRYLIREREEPHPTASVLFLYLVRLMDLMSEGFESELGDKICEMMCKCIEKFAFTSIFYHEFPVIENLPCRRHY